MEDLELQAYLYGGKNGGEYLQSIGKYDLSQLSKDEWLAFCECICKNYHHKKIELENKRDFI